MPLVEADSLAYLSIDALHRAVADDHDEYCYACYTGDYPTDLVQIEELTAAARDRRWSGRDFHVSPLKYWDVFPRFRA